MIDRKAARVIVTCSLAAYAAGQHLQYAHAPMQQVLSASVAKQKLSAIVMGGFSLIALVLAAIGIYGVMAYQVTQRRREIAIRMALGAGRIRVVGLILRETSLLVVAGLAVGTAVTLVAARSASGLLFGLSPHDPTTIAGAAAALAIMAAAASAVPALRASRIDATSALRSE